MVSIIVPQVVSPPCPGAEAAVPGGFVTLNLALAAAERVFPCHGPKLVAPCSHGEATEHLGHQGTVVSLPAGVRARSLSHILCSLRITLPSKMSSLQAHAWKRGHQWDHATSLQNSRTSHVPPREPCKHPPGSVSAGPENASESERCFVSACRSRDGRELKCGARLGLLQSSGERRRLCLQLLIKGTAESCSRPCSAHGDARRRSAPSWPWWPAFPKRGLCLLRQGLTKMLLAPAGHGAACPLALRGTEGDTARMSSLLASRPASPA